MILIQYNDYEYCSIVFWLILILQRLYVFKKILQSKLYLDFLINYSFTFLRLMCLIKTC